MRQAGDVMERNDSPTGIAEIHTKAIASDEKLQEGWEQWLQDSAPEKQYLDEIEQAFLGDDQSSIDETTPSKSAQIVVNDWSQTGRGTHVDFKNAETVPLEQGR